MRIKIRYPILGIIALIVSTVVVAHAQIGIGPNESTYSQAKGQVIANNYVTDGSVSISFALAYVPNMNVSCAWVNATSTGSSCILKVNLVTNPGVPLIDGADVFFGSNYKQIRVGDSVMVFGSYVKDFGASVVPCNLGACQGIYPGYSSQGYVPIMLKDYNIGLSAPEATIQVGLQFGMRGDAVLQLQQKLQAEGYLAADSITGYFGTKTMAGVKNFQKAMGIAMTGYVGPLTAAALSK